MTNPAADAPALVWFRDDLRLADQPALHAAIRSKRPVICLYVYDAGRSSCRALGGASKWWLHHSLAALGTSLEKIGARLDLIACDHADLPQIAQSLGAGAVYWTRRYGGAQIACDAQVKKDLAAANIEAASFNGHLLREPWEVTTKTGGPMKVFTPFWRASQALGDIPAPLPAPKAFASAPWPKGGQKRATLKTLDLLPTKPDWAKYTRSLLLSIISILLPG